jgi:16S rRNA (guanine(966)-N(2))-methyltransferase RsmD
MRIISGAAAGTILKVPKGFDVRPTPDLVRQAIFNSLGDRVGGARVVEFFAGTGALSLECLSRGAARALCVELSSKHAQYIRENLRASKLDVGTLDIRVQDAFIAIAQLAQTGQQFDLIMADPPYGEKNVGRRSTSFAQKMLDNPDLPKLVKPESLFVLGHTKRDSLTVPVCWAETKMLKHGDTVIRFFQRQDAGAAESQPALE